jgi:hypothetical protein
MIRCQLHPQTQKPEGDFFLFPLILRVSSMTSINFTLPNILFVLTAAATTGAGSTLHGSILAGAAVTHSAGSNVSGYVVATAIGGGCSLTRPRLWSTPPALSMRMHPKNSTPRPFRP